MADLSNINIVPCKCTILFCVILVFCSPGVRLLARPLLPMASPYQSDQPASHNGEFFDAIDYIKTVIKNNVSNSDIISGALNKLDFLSTSFSTLISSHISKIVAEASDEKDRRRIVVLDGLPENQDPKGSVRNSADLELVRSISDTLGLDSSIWSTERLGRRSDRPRLLKVFFHSSIAASLFLKGFHSLRRNDASFESIFARPSLSEAERKHQFDLRQEARKRTKEEKVDFVVYAGKVVRKDSIASLKKQLSANSSEQSKPLSHGSSASSHSHPHSSHSRSSSRRRRNADENPTTAKRTLISDTDLRAALLNKSYTSWNKPNYSSSGHNSRSSQSTIGPSKPSGSPNENH